MLDTFTFSANGRSKLTSKKRSFFPPVKPVLFLAQPVCVVSISLSVTGVD